MGEEHASQWLSEKPPRYGGRLGYNMLAVAYSTLLSRCGDNVTLGDGTTASKGGRHRWRSCLHGKLLCFGGGAVVMADVGRYAVRRAGAVVIRPISDFSVVTGVPAKVTRRTDAIPGTHRDPMRVEYAVPELRAGLPEGYEALT